MEHLKNILFLDIETVPLVPGYDMLTEAMQKEWNRKAKFLKSSDGQPMDNALLFSDRAGIFSEFAKVVCISFGSFHKHDDFWRLRLKSIVNNDEKILLKDFCEVVTRFASRYTDLRFCGHNIKEFDIPFLCRRMIINDLGLPECMQLQGKKPWEISHLDTLEMWKFGDHKHFTALSLLAEVLGIPSPKDDMDGSMVGPVYWQEHDLPRIATYCMQDVLTSAKVFLKLSGMTGNAPEPLFVTE
jgi:hypothetical protein